MVCPFFYWTGKPQANQQQDNSGEQRNQECFMMKFTRLFRLGSAKKCVTVNKCPNDTDGQEVILGIERNKEGPAAKAGRSSSKRSQLSYDIRKDKFNERIRTYQNHGQREVDGGENSSRGNNHAPVSVENGHQALFLSRNHQRRGALCECAMVEDIEGLRNKLLAHNLKISGLL